MLLLHISQTIVTPYMLELVGPAFIQHFLSSTEAKIYAYTRLNLLMRAEKFYNVF